MPGHILIVDDDDDLRSALAEVLSLRGYRVREAGNGRDALAMAAERRPGVVLLDLAMPVMDGRATLEELRRHPDLSKTPVIVVSAEGITPEDVTVVKKPYTVERIVELIRRVAGTPRGADGSRASSAVGSSP